MDQQKILLIEDDKDQRGIFALLLEHNSYEVVQAKTCAAGLAQLRSSHFDCVVCDVMMPDMNGQQFVETVRQTEQTQDIPIVMITAAREDLELPLLASGADMFCLKKDAHKELVKQIQMLLEDESLF